MNNTALLLDSLDNVGVALCDLSPEEQVNLEQHSLEIRQFIPAKHKFALQDFQPGDDIFMYGTVVAEVTQEIKQGAALTVENIRHKTNTYQLTDKIAPRAKVDTGSWPSRTFLGFKRADGQVGTANYWLVLPLVFCENTNIKLLQEAFENALRTANQSTCIRKYCRESTKWKFRHSSGSPQQDFSSSRWHSIPNP
jgi:altronate hydrolase